MIICWKKVGGLLDNKGYGIGLPPSKIYNKCYYFLLCNFQVCLPFAFINNYQLENSLANPQAFIKISSPIQTWDLRRSVFDGFYLLHYKSSKIKIATSCQTSYCSRLRLWICMKREEFKLTFHFRLSVQNSDDQRHPAAARGRQTSPSQGEMVEKNAGRGSVRGKRKKSIKKTNQKNIRKVQGERK